MTRIDMMRPLLLAGLAALLVAAPASAQGAADLAGSWTFDQETPRGTMTHTVTFALEEVGWVGTMSNDRRTFDLEDITFDDRAVSFTFEAGPPPGRGGQGRQGQRPQSELRPNQGGGGRPASARTFEGLLDGDAIHGEMTGPRGEMAVVLTRLES